LLGADQASAFQRVMRPQGVALPIINLAAWLWRDGDRIHQVRIAIGPGGPVPHRATQAEDSLRGAVFGEAALDQALDAILGQARFRTSAHRATSEYRRHLVGGLLRDVLESAWQRTVPVAV
jgi:xanthine dehydrogenase FAD-binding subunit